MLQDLSKSVGSFQSPFHSTWALERHCHMWGWSFWPAWLFSFITQQKVMPTSKSCSRIKSLIFWNTYSVKAPCLGLITVYITLKYLNFSVFELWKELGLQQLMIETITCINVDISDGKRIKSNVKFPQITWLFLQKESFL